MRFSISTDDEVEKLHLAHNHHAWLLLHDIDGRIRNFIKYNETTDPVDFIRNIRSEILELLSKVEE